MNNRTIDILGYFGALLVTSLGSVFSSLDIAAKIIGVLGGGALAILAIVHKTIQISSEKIKKESLKKQLENATREEIREVKQIVNNEIQKRDEIN